jgi:phage tail-like protein
LKGKYFIFNKYSDFIHGFSHNLIFDKNKGLTIADNFSEGVFYSLVFDSLEKQTLWYRLETDAVIRNNTTIRLTFFSNDTPYVYDEKGVKRDIYDTVKNYKIPPEEKDYIFKNCNSETFINPDENIFRSIRGRYIWFKAEFFAQQKEYPAIHKIKAYIREKNWVDYLPEIYRQNQKSFSFTERYLSLFQNVYEYTETEIDDIDLLFNPDIADREFLEWLCSWVSISDVYMWNDAQLRYLMKNAVRMYKTFGTKESIITMIQLYTGEKPLIVENCSIYSENTDENVKKLYSRLYSSNPFVFTVLIRNECIKSDVQYETLLKIIESVKPVHMEVNLIILQPMILLDGYSYMGINTDLTELSSVRLDGSSSVDFTVL